MGDVIAFKPKPTPAMPAWRRALWEQWNNPANWRVGQGGEVCGDRRGERTFSWGGLGAIVHLYELEDGYCGWSFRVGHPLAAVISECIWCDPADALDAAWEELVELAQKREKGDAMTDDHIDYIKNVINHRCPELSDDDLATIIQPAEPRAETLPVEVLDQVLDVVMALDDRLAALEATVQAGNDIVGNVWLAMRDYTLEQKTAMLERLEGLIEMEASTYHPLQ